VTATADDDAATQLTVTMEVYIHPPVCVTTMLSTLGAPKMATSTAMPHSGTGAFSEVLVDVDHNFPGGCPFTVQSIAWITGGPLTGVTVTTTADDTQVQLDIAERTDNADVGTYKLQYDILDAAGTT